jgi:hypothetical protein
MMKESRVEVISDDIDVFTEYLETEKEVMGACLARIMKDLGYSVEVVIYEDGHVGVTRIEREEKL